MSSICSQQLPALDSSKTNYERMTYTIHDCLTVTIDGLKCTNDITSLHSQ